MIIVFILGYILIALEYPLRINKSATALLLAAMMWMLVAFTGEQSLISAELLNHLGVNHGIHKIRRWNSL